MLLASLSEVWTHSFLWHTLPWTLFLGFCLGYWLLVIFGAADLDSSDGGGVDGGDGVSSDSSGAHGLLKLFQLGEVPVMVILSLFALSGWGLSMLLNSSFNPEGAAIPGLTIAVGTLVASVLIARLASAPLRPIFQALHRDMDTGEVILGRSGVVKTPELRADVVGHVEIPTGHAPLLVVCRLAGGLDTVPRGTEVIFISQSEDGAWLVRPIDAQAKAVS